MPFMPIFKRSIPVKCKIERAFSYIADWTNLKDFMPMFLNVKPVSLVSYGPGTSLEVTFSLSKVEVITTLDLVEFVMNKRLMFKAAKGLKTKLSWDFAQVGDRVILTEVFEYEIPPGLTARPSELEAMEKDMQALAVQSLDMLRWVLEARNTMDDKEE